MIDYVEEDHGLQTVQQNFTAEQHGKGTFLLPFCFTLAVAHCADAFNLQLWVF